MFLAVCHARFCERVCVGVNRSATLCVAHLVQSERWKLISAVEHVHDLRPIVLSNADFVMQLVQLADRQNLG